MQLLERLEHGMYQRDSEVIEPSTPAQYCVGANRDAQSMTEKIMKGHEVHVRHPPSRPPGASLPSI